jgi:hypothetical protein
MAYNEGIGLIGSLWPLSLRQADVSMPFGFFFAFCSQRQRLMGIGLGLALSCLVGAVFSPGMAQLDGFFLTEENAAIYQKIPAIETQLYGHGYPEQSVSQRLSRIEKTLFGAAQRAPTEQRMRLVEARINEKHSQAVKAEQEPMLVYLEEKLFQRTYPDKPTPERLRQLEMQVFGHSFDNYPVDIRMKKLTYAMPVMAREIRLSKGDTVIASAGKISRHAVRCPSPKVDMVQLDASGNNLRVQPNGAPLSTGDYVQSIYRESDGDVLRWHTLPIKVYLKPGEPEAALSSKALQAWKSAFSVELVQNSAQADVIVTWDKPTWDMDTLGILTRPVVHVDESRNIRTVILISLFSFKGQSAANQLHVVSHQMGHAFGLWGHSDDPGDVMYPALKQEMTDFPSRWSWRSAAANTKVQPPGVADDFHPSQRDINTLMKLYALPVTDLSTYSPY